MTKDANPPVTRDSDKFMLRLPEGMRDRIAEIAKANGRSMNAEIVARLQQSLDQGSGVTLEQLASDPALIKMLADKINEQILERTRDLLDQYKRSFGQLPINPSPEFPSQDDDMPPTPPKRRINTKRHKD